MTWLGLGTVLLLSNVDGEYAEHCEKGLKTYMYINIIENMVSLLVLACFGLITSVNAPH
jgi:hypothetical protein